MEIMSAIGCQQEVEQTFSLRSLPGFLDCMHENEAFAFAWNAMHAFSCKG